MIERKTMSSRPNVAPLFPVAWAYTAASGKEPLTPSTASRSVIAYKIAMA